MNKLNTQNQYIPTGMKDEKGQEIYYDTIVGTYIPSSASLWNDVKINIVFKEIKIDDKQQAELNATIEPILKVEETKVEETKVEETKVETEMTCTCTILDPIRRKE